MEKLKLNAAQKALRVVGLSMEKGAAWKACFAFAQAETPACNAKEKGADYKARALEVVSKSARHALTDLPLAQSSLRPIISQAVSVICAEGKKADAPANFADLSKRSKAGNEKLGVKPRGKSGGKQAATPSATPSATPTEPAATQTPTESADALASVCREVSRILRDGSPSERTALADAVKAAGWHLALGEKAGTAKPAAKPAAKRGAKASAKRGATQELRA